MENKISKTAQIHPKALIERDVCIGDRTRIWAFVHLLSSVKIGMDCNVCDHCLIESGVVVGDRVTLKSGVYLWDGVKLEDDVFVGPCVTFTNDIFPRSKQHPSSYTSTLIKKGASLGANSTIIAGITVGEYAMIGAGSVITKDIPDYSLFYGNPAKFQGWICSCSNKLFFEHEATQCQCGISYQLKKNLVSKRI